MAKLSFEEFKAKMKKAAEMEYPNAEVTIEDVQKNNGLILTGMRVKTKDVNITPTIYLNNAYRAYSEDEVSFKEVFDSFKENYEKYKMDEPFDVTVFTDWDKVKDKICYKLINIDMNERLLRDVPYIEFEDLAIVFYIIVENVSNDDEISSILIRGSHLECWNKDVNDLYELAKKNTPKLLPATLKTLGDVLPILKMQDATTEDEDDTPMIIASNKMMLYGAGVILYDNILKEFSEKNNKDVLIIPSSVHETLLLPDNGDLDASYLTTLIKNVNAAQVEPDEILSDHAYKYIRSEDKIVAA